MPTRIELNPVGDFQSSEKPIKGVVEHTWWIGKTFTLWRGLSFEIDHKGVGEATARKYCINKGSLARYICDMYAPTEDSHQYKKYKEIVRSIITECYKDKEHPKTLAEFVGFVLKRLATKELKDVLDLHERMPDTREEYRKISDVFDAVQHPSVEAPPTEGVLSTQHKISQAGEQELRALKLKDEAIKRVREATIGQADRKLGQVFDELSKIRNLPRPLKEILGKGASFQNYEDFVEQLKALTHKPDLSSALSANESIIASAKELVTHIAIQQAHAALLDQCELAIREFREQQLQAQALQIDTTGQEGLIEGLSREVTSSSSKKGSASQEDVDGLTRIKDQITEAKETVSKRISDKRLGEVRTSTSKLCNDLSRAKVPTKALEERLAKLEEKGRTPSSQEIEQYAGALRDLSAKLHKLEEMEQKLAKATDKKEEDPNDFSSAQEAVERLRSALQGVVQHPSDRDEQDRFDGAFKACQAAITTLKRAIELLEVPRIIEQLKTCGIEISGLEKSIEGKLNTEERYRVVVKRLQDRGISLSEDGDPLLKQVEAYLLGNLQMSLGVVSKAGRKGASLDECLTTWTAWQREKRDLLLKMDFSEVCSEFPGQKAGMIAAQRQLQDRLKLPFPEHTYIEATERLLSYAKSLKELSAKRKLQSEKLLALQKQTQEKQDPRCTELFSTIKRGFDAIGDLSYDEKADPQLLDLQGKVKKISDDIGELELAIASPTAKPKPAATSVAPVVSKPIQKEAEIQQRYLDRCVAFESSVDEIMQRAGLYEGSTEFMPQNRDKFVAEIKKMYQTIQQFKADAKSAEEKEALTHVSERLATLERRLDEAQKEIALNKEAENVLGSWARGEKPSFEALDRARKTVEGIEEREIVDLSDELENCIEMFTVLKKFRDDSRGFLGRWIGVWKDKETGQLATGRSILMPSSEGITELLEKIRPLMPLLLRISPDDRSEMIKSLRALQEYYVGYTDIEEITAEYIDALQKGK
jgi:hypothetical protein